MNIVISADDKFILPTKVMLTSFFLNNQQEHHDIYFLYSAVEEQNLRELEKLIQAFGGIFHPVLIKEALFAGFKCKNQYPILVYYRLLVAQILPNTEERALWMDVDLVVNGSLDAFYYQEFDGYALAACRDCDAPTRMAQLGCPPGSVYINAGVVLYNIVAMRQYALADFYSYYTAHEASIMMQDQDILNGMFAGNIKVWENNLYNDFVPSGYAEKGFDYQRWKTAVKIVHYIGKHKPWMNTYAHPAGKLWDEYYLLTTKRSASFSRYYLCKKAVTRGLQRKFIFPLRLLHGTLNEKRNRLSKTNG